MKILIINQPVNNRGDEAAHRSLVRELNKRLPSVEISIVFSGFQQDSVDQMKVNSSQNKYYNIQTFIKGAKLVKKWSLRFGLIKLSSHFPSHRILAQHIRNSDLVICAPGGICMGLFQNWDHIYNLALALAYNKKVAYFSRSFGPFPNQTKWNRVFQKISLDLLTRFDFISIRDAQTMKLAEKLQLSYTPAIDTAFLDTPHSELPGDLKDLIGNEKYVVLVPNSLTWHPAFKRGSKDYFERFYLSIIDMILDEKKTMNIILLPQLFNSLQNDIKYFERLKMLKNNNPRLIIIPDKYGSDIQQVIISKAELLIGARYHSVVFAINNEVPFIALSYEHKVSGLLQILNLDEYMFSIEELGVKQPDIADVIGQIRKIAQNAAVSKTAKEKARNIAKEGMNEFLRKFGLLTTTLT